MVLSPSELMSLQPNRAKGGPMSVECAYDLVLCGILLMVFTYVATASQPSIPRVTRLLTLAGGALCVLWGICKRLPQGSTSAMVTLVAMACVLLAQAGLAWIQVAANESKDRTLLLLMMVLAAFCLRTLANLFRERKTA
jgi:peptidoglycan/LPS O-acetylase OafA/YrhL